MPGSDGLFLRSIFGLAAIALALGGCSSTAVTPAGQLPMTRALGNRPATGAQDLYIGNILGGVLLFSTGKNPQEVGDITNQLPRVTSVWVDHTGVLYAFTD